MKISHKFHLISLSILILMSIAVILSGTLIISDQAYQLQDHILHLELEKIEQAIFETLNRSGVRAAVKSAADLQTALQKAAQLKEGSHHLKTAQIFIIEAPDRVVFHQEHRFREQIEWAELGNMFEQRDGNVDFILKKKDEYAVFKTISPMDWLIGIAITKDEMYAGRREYLKKISMISLVAVIISGLLIKLFVNRFVKRLHRTLDCLREIEKGNLTTRIHPVTTHDEVGHLQIGFNNMAARIEKRAGELHNEIRRRKAVEEALRLDVQTRLKAEEELRKARNFISSIIDSMPSVLITVDMDGEITQWNDTASRSTGIKADKACGRQLSDLVPGMASHMDTIRESIRTRQVRCNRKNTTGPEDETRYEEFTIYPLVSNGTEGAVIRIDDVTDRVRMEEMMIQSEKMLSVGGLAAGMAHEINNPLASMIQTSHVMRNRLGKKRNIPANKKAAEAAGLSMDALDTYMENRGIFRMLDAIDSSGKRVAEIVKNMLSFARKTDSVVLSHNLNDLLDNTLELVGTDYDLTKKYDFKQIEIRKEYADNLPNVPCESEKIQQVLLNIFNNGAQAMQQAKTENPTFTLRNYFVQERQMVCLEIEDNGPGMDKTVSKRIFEPFFTTKPAGVGTGLGLSVSYFIIAEIHGGELQVVSSPGNGSRFIIMLPVNNRNGNN